MTVVTPVRPRYHPPGGVLWLRAVFAIARTLSDRTNRKIRALSFIHFARWVVIRRLPEIGQPGDRLQQPLLLFVSDYSGTFDQYIDAFAGGLARGVEAFWGACYGVPGVQPVAPLKDYIRANEFRTDHYYMAYPAATGTVRSAVALKVPLEAFTVRAATLDPARFRREYEKFLTQMQEHL